MTKIKSKGYSYDLVQALVAGDQSKPWVELGVLAVQNNVSVRTLSEKLGVSRQAVYEWFFGVVTPSPKNVAKINEAIAEYHRAKL